MLNFLIGLGGGTISAKCSRSALAALLTFKTRLFKKFMRIFAAPQLAPIGEGGGDMFRKRRFRTFVL